MRSFPQPVNNWFRRCFVSYLVDRSGCCWYIVWLYLGKRTLFLGILILKSWLSPAFSSQPLLVVSSWSFCTSTYSGEIILHRFGQWWWSTRFIFLVKSKIIKNHQFFAFQASPKPTIWFWCHPIFSFKFFHFHLCFPQLIFLIRLNASKISFSMKYRASMLK